MGKGNNSEQKLCQHKADEFVTRYYSKLNGNSPNISSMYANNCSITWPDSTGATLTLVSAEGIDKFMPKKKSARPQYKVTDFSVQPCSLGLFLLVQGIRTATDKKTCTFVQSFLLLEKCGDLIVSNDILAITAFNENPEDEDRISTRSMAVRKTIGQVAEVPTIAVQSGVCIVTEDRVSTRNTAARKMSGIQHKECKGIDAEGKMIDAALSRHQVTEVPTIAVESRVCIVTDTSMMEHKAEYFCAGNSKRMMKHNFEHDMYHERPERLSAIVDKLEEESLLPRVHRLQAQLADDDDVWRVHKKKYVDFLRELPMSKNKQANYKGFFTSDMFCSTGTPTAAFLAAGAVVQACQAVAGGNFANAFAIVRPPGHHTCGGTAEGYCFLNNIAIGAEHLLKIMGLKKVLVVDFDVHHGNGTMKHFYERNDVLFFSTFCKSLVYPSEAECKIDNIGDGDGTGYNVNVPLGAGFGDPDLLMVWEALLIPLAIEFQPDLVLVSAGYDAAVGDPLGECLVTPPCFYTLVQQLCKLDTRGVVLALEGGYNLDSLAECSAQSLHALLGDEQIQVEKTEPSVPGEQTIIAINQLKVLLKEHWNAFKADPAKTKHVKEESPKPVFEEQEGEAAKRNPLDLLPPSKMVLDDWKRLYTKTTRNFHEVAVKEFWNMYDPEGFSLWFCEYKHQEENTTTYVPLNKVMDLFRSMVACRDHAFGKMFLVGSEAPYKLKGLWLFRGQEIPKFAMKEVYDMELYNWSKVDVSESTQKERVNAMLEDLDPLEGHSLVDVKCFK